MRLGLDEHAVSSSVLERIVTAAARFGSFRDATAAVQMGLPTTSSLVESLVGEFNTRVKGKQKHWARPAGAESILQL